MMKFSFCSLIVSGLYLLRSTRAFINGASMKELSKLCRSLPPPYRGYCFAFYARRCHEQETMDRTCTRHYELYAEEFGDDCLPGYMLVDTTEDEGGEDSICLANADYLCDCSIEVVDDPCDFDFDTTIPGCLPYLFDVGFPTGGAGAPVYLAAVLEYLCAEILERNLNTQPGDSFEFDTQPGDSFEFDVGQYLAEWFGVECD